MRLMRRSQLRKAEPTWYRRPDYLSVLLTGVLIGIVLTLTAGVAALVLAVLTA